MLYHLTAAAILALSPFALAQGRDVQLLSRLNPRFHYNDIWGYVAPNGDEFALLGASDGVVVIDCSNPENPVRTGFFPGPVSTWRDIRTYRHYAYAVTEATGGMSIIDLSNPRSPQLVTTWGANRWAHAHNICIDTTTGWIYIAGTGVGTAVIDASANQTNPSFVGYDNGHAHDLQVQNGLGHGAMMSLGRYRIFDVRSWPFTVISETTTPGRFTHSAWPNANATLAVTTDEVTGGIVQLWDISDPRNPVRRGGYVSNRAAIPHNPFIVGDVLHVSYYTEGYRAVDISDPSNPVEIGSYDTWPGADGGFNGAWGCFPFLPSGNVFVSDIDTGLYVLRPNRLSISHAPLSSTTDEDGPYRVVATVASGTPLSAVQLVWSVNGGAGSTVAMTPTGRPGEFAASIPGQLAPATVEYRITARNAIGSATVPDRTKTHAFDVGTFARLFFDDFESGPNGWTHGMTRTEDDWQFGTPTAKNGNASGVDWRDPPGAFSGRNVWGNDIGIGPWNGRYLRGVSNWLESPRIPTNGAQGLVLRFRRWLTVQQGTGDQAKVLVNGQTVWQNPQSSHLVDGEWELVQYDIAPISDSAASIRIRFTLDTDNSLQLGGWHIDDVELFQLGDCVPPVHYGQGSPGTGGFVPTIGASGPPRIGSSSFAITGSSILGGAAAVLALGRQPGNLPILGATLLVDPLIVALPYTASGAPGAAGAGAVNASLPIPPNPALDDVTLAMQWIVVDPGSPGGALAASDGLRFRICRD